MKCTPISTNCIFLADKETPLCDLESYSCISDVYGIKKLYYEAFRMNFLKLCFIFQEAVRDDGDEICNCLPPCTDVRSRPFC